MHNNIIELFYQNLFNKRNCVIGLKTNKFLCETKNKQIYAKRESPAAIIVRNRVHFEIWQVNKTNELKQFRNQ